VFCGSEAENNFCMVLFVQLTWSYTATSS